MRAKDAWRFEDRKKKKRKLCDYKCVSPVTAALKKNPGGVTFSYIAMLYYVIVDGFTMVENLGAGEGWYKEHSEGHFLFLPFLLVLWVSEGYFSMWCLLTQMNC